MCIGERMPAWVAEGLAEYRKRLSHALPLELVEIPHRTRSRDAEGAAVLGVLQKTWHVVALDGGGEAWPSERLAEELTRWRMAGRDVAFVVGGPEGHAPAVLERADRRWSLGPLTLPHMLVRLVVAEQLYRATTIVAGHPYHRA